MRLFLAFCFLIFLVGCTSVALEPPIPFDNGAVSLIDNRTLSQKTYRRDSNFSAVVFFGDDKFQPSALEYFQAALLKKNTGSRPMRLEIDEFRVIDYFPVRIGAGISGFVTQALMQGLVESNTDWGFIKDLGIPDRRDSVICVFSGKVNGKSVKGAAFEPYKISAFAGLVANDPDFRRAMKLSIEKAAENIASQI